MPATPPVRRATLPQWAFQGALSGFSPDERAAIEIDASPAPRPSLDEVQEGDLVMFIPTSRVSIETNPADIPEAQ